MRNSYLHNIYLYAIQVEGLLKNLFSSETDHINYCSVYQIIAEPQCVLSLDFKKRSYLAGVVGSLTVVGG